MKKQIKITLIIAIILLVIVIFFVLYSTEETEPDINQTEIEPIINESGNTTKVEIDEIEKKLFEVNQNGFVVVTEELSLLMKNLIKEEDPEILIKTSFFSARSVEGNSSQITALYVSGSAIPESPHATIIFDLEKEEIISIAKNWWDQYGPVCCYGIPFYKEESAGYVGYTNCSLMECKEPPTDEDKQNWICPNTEHIDCAYINTKLPYCNTTYGDWMKDNCNITFSY